MPFVAGNKTPREAGGGTLKKMAEQQAADGEIRMASPSNKTRHGKNTKQKFCPRQGVQHLCIYLDHLASRWNV